MQLQAQKLQGRCAKASRCLADVHAPCSRSVVVAPAWLSATRRSAQGVGSATAPAPGGRLHSVVVKAATGSPFPKKNARLVLEDGSVWHGTSFGHSGTEIGEVGLMARP